MPYGYWQLLMVLFTIFGHFLHLVIGITTRACIKYYGKFTVIFVLQFLLKNDKL